MTLDENVIRKVVRDHYAKLAQSGDKSESCCSSAPAPRADVPLEACQIYAGCGSPIEAAEIRQGEIVVDLGSGGGLDAFRASKLVGQSGLVIGVDATPEMIWRARETAKKHQFSNVDFRLGEIEHVPVDSSSVDVVLSNCVINLTPDKGRVFREAFRVLKPGGRLIVSDVVTKGPLNVDRSDLDAWAGCIAGALPNEEYVALIEKAGFAEVQVTQNNPQGIDDKQAQSCCSSEVESVTVTAAKPNRASR